MDEGGPEPDNSRSIVDLTPADRLAEYRRYMDMSPEERDREIALACRTAMNQWMARPERERVRWPPEPGPAGEVILRQWAKEIREANP